MLSKNLFLYLYKAAFMQRWNDYLRPIDFYELDKQAHKMIFAYTLAKTEENFGKKIDWVKLIEGGIFEFLQRVSWTDIKPALFFKIKNDKEKYKQLNLFLIKKIEPDFVSINDGIFLKKFKDYIFDETCDYDINKRILQAAHFLATKWEFDIIKDYNLNGYQTEEVKNDMIAREQEFADLTSVKELAFSDNLKKFVNICGSLRYQIRWNQLYRIPKTSVLGHMFLVALISYFFSIESSACDSRIYNNFFTGLFHDLPEALTRDIISPIKFNVEGLDDFIKDYEREEMKKIYSILPKNITKDLKIFTENEFSNLILKDEKYYEIADFIPQQYNYDKYSPRDGILVKIADKLAAYIEAYLTINNGIKNEELDKAIETIYEKFKDYNISNVSMRQVFDYFFN